jgi:hypothetical protein
LSFFGGSSNQYTGDNRTIPKFENYCSNLAEVTLENLKGFFDLIKSEEFHELIGLNSRRKTSDNCTLNAVEIAMDMLKDFPCSHIVCFSFSHSLNYCFGNPKSSILDYEDKFKKIGNLLVDYGIVYESFSLAKCSLSTKNHFSLLTGGHAVFIPDFSVNPNG